MLKVFIPVKILKDSRITFVAAFFILWMMPIWVAAQIFNSSDFQVHDPVMFSGGYSTSDDYRLFHSISQVAVGTSTATNFQLNSGFLYFPFVSTPAVSATAGNGQVSLSWTAAQGFLGWTASGYNVGQSTVSGGPYTYSSSLGNVTSSTRTGLTNGTTYYFVVRVEDAFGNSIATSSQISATPSAPSSPSPSGGGGGGGGGGGASSLTGVTFSGRAYPKSAITILKDAQVAATTIAGADANFSVSVLGISGGNYIFSIYSEDSKGVRSSLLTFPVSVISGVITNIGGIFLAPTIAVDKSEVKRGDNIAIFGQSAPNSEIIIGVNSEEELFVKTSADKDGVYLHNFDTSPLAMEQHFTRSKAAYKGEISSFSKSVSFIVGAKNVSAAPAVKCPAKADLNSDCRVNLVDFSIAAFWYKRPISAEFAVKEKERLNGDGKVNLIDFSIMAFYWTG